MIDTGNKLKSLSKSLLESAGELLSENNTKDRSTRTDRHLHARRTAIPKSMRVREQYAEPVVQMKDIPTSRLKEILELGESAHNMSPSFAIKLRAVREELDRRRRLGIKLEDEHPTAEEAEQLDELSKGTLSRYANRALNDVRNANQARVRWASKENKDRVADIRDPSGKYVRKTSQDMVDLHARVAKNRETGIRRAIARMAKEETEHLEEAKRGRPRKNPSPITQNIGLDEPEARQHIMQQLQRAKLSMHGGDHITFRDGTRHFVRGDHAAKLIAKYSAMKPFEKLAFQKKISNSHLDLKSEL